MASIPYCLEAGPRVELFFLSRSTRIVSLFTRRSSSMPAGGWNALLAGAPWFRGKDAYPIPAYSEFMPPPRLGRKAYPFAEVDSSLVRPDDPEGWPVSEFEEAWELQLGLNHFAQRLVRSLV